MYIVAINKHSAKLKIWSVEMPREVVAQTLDYASWIKNLSFSEIKNICEEYYSEGSFETIFEEKFGVTPPDKLNQEHDMLIVSVKLDNETERIINYLSDTYNVPINAVFFRFFKDNILPPIKWG